MGLELLMGDSHKILVWLESNPTILIDCDEILYPFVGGYIVYWTKRRREQGKPEKVAGFDRPVQFDDITVFDFSQTPLGGTGNEHIEMVEEYHHSSEAQVVRPYPYVKELIGLLSPYAQLHLLTSRPRSVEKLTVEWLEAEGVGQHFQDYHFLAHWQGGKESKGDRGEKVGGQLALEDHWNHCVNLADKRIPVLSPTKPWNQSSLSLLGADHIRYSSLIGVINDYQKDVLAPLKRALGK